MTNREIIEKVCAGLRAMDIKPDALLYIDSEEEYFDGDSISGIPIYRNLLLANNPITDLDVSFIPIWKSDIGKYASTKQFNDAYADYL